MLRIIVVALLALLTACDNGEWNNPHAEVGHNEKVMYLTFTSPPKNLDPVRSYNKDEATLIDQIYEPPLQYDYLQRPYVLKPLTLTQLPTVEYLDESGHGLPADHATPTYSRYTFEIKRGINFQPHAAFALNAQGKPRYNFANLKDAAGYRRIEDFEHTGTKELVAKDYIYQIKRMADPKLQLPIWDIVSEYVVGLETLRQQIVEKREEQSGEWVDLRTLPLAGVREINSHSFSVTLQGRYPQFKYWLAFHFFAPVPAEVDRFYHLPGQQDKNISLAFHPVGTGAFMMIKHDASSEIVLAKNPNFHEEYYPSEGGAGDAESGLLDAAGQSLPFLDRVIFRLEKEAIPVWTKFLQGYYDRSGVSSDSFDQAVNVGVDGISLSDEMRAKGIELSVNIEPAIYYVGFNMLDPVVGGYTDRQRKLRTAIAVAYDEFEQISIFRNGSGEVAMGPIPPEITGYSAGEAGINRQVFDWDGAAQKKPIDYAKQLLREAGYPDGRDEVTGSPLVLNFDTTQTGGGSARQSWLIKQFAKLGIQLNIRATDYNRFQDKMESGHAQIFFWGWFADYPDPENFLFLLYGPNSRVGSGGSGVNSSNYNNPEYNKLFNKMKVMPDSPQRLEIIRQMVAIYHRDVPWASGFHPSSFVLSNAWTKNYKAHGMSQVTLKYQSIDIDLRAQKRREWNRPVLWPLWLCAGVVLVTGVPGYRAYRRRQLKRIN